MSLKNKYVVKAEGVKKISIFYQGHIWVVYHLHKYSSIYKWKINGTHIFGRPNRKITGINSLLEKVVLFDQLKHFK